jgi:quercetin dioxygenase-like cupin family protein
MNPFSDPEEVKSILVEPAHTDERGSIFDLVEESVGHVGLITFTAGSIRANHYHNVSVQYSYVLKGEIELTTARIDGTDKKVERLKVGTLTRIPAKIVHAYKALSDAEILDMTTLTRADNGYESDTVRVKIV